MTRLHFTDGTTEDLPKTGIVVIVGPNNAGKSVLLSETHNAIVNGRTEFPQPRWLESVETTRDGTQAEFEGWFTSLARVVPDGWPGAGQPGIWDNQSGGGQVLTLDAAGTIWFRDSPLGPLAPRLVSYLDAMSRPGLLGGASARDAMAPPSHPLHRIWDDRSAEEKLSRLVRRAFGFDVCINRYSQQLQLLMGRPTLCDEPLPASRELLDEYARLVPVSSQGDGVRSFVGLLLMSIAAGMSVTMLDEPEAFLHPPQAKLLGRYLAEETPTNGQVILATHSSDVLEGVLDGATTRAVKVIRVSQVVGSDVRKRNTLPPERVKALWTDPLLRYSRMLDGLFHKGIIVCESDGDCRFYAAALDVHLQRRTEHDLVLTHVGGKARLPQALHQLVGFGIPTAVIGDIDILNDSTLVEKLVAAGNGTFADLKPDLDVIHKQVNARAGGPTVQALRSATLDILKRRDNSSISDAEAEGVRKAVKTKSGWAEVKRSGVLAFEDEATTAIERVLSTLRGLGIFLAPVGELERWYTDVNAGHGTSYVTAVLESARHENPPPALTSFVEHITNHFGIGTSEPVGEIPS